jgi:hypothetical protein
MADPLLTAFWIKSPFSRARLGFGGTARSLNEALTILRAVNFGQYLPDDDRRFRITPGISITDLDHHHVLKSMGPIALRGLWYPFIVLGVPRWLEDRLGGEDLSCEGE